MRLSYTQLNTYYTCPYRYYLQYFENIPTDETEALRFGKRFHEKILEVDEEDEQIMKMQEALWANEEFKKFKNIQLEVMDTERIGGYNYYMRHDGIDGDTILEFKSAIREWKEEDFNNLIQPYLAMKIRGGRFVYFIVTKHKKPRVQVREIKFEEKEWDRLANLSESIMKDFTYKRNKAQHCYFCPFQKHCDAWF